MINIIVIRDLQIKTTIRCHCTLLECLKSQLLITPHAGKDVKQQELSLTADENANGTARDFPGGPVVKNLPSNEGGTGWILGQKLIVHVPWVWQKKNKTKKLFKSMSL